METGMRIAIIIDEIIIKFLKEVNNGEQVIIEW